MRQGTGVLVTFPGEEACDRVREKQAASAAGCWPLGPQQPEDAPRGLEVRRTAPGRLHQTFLSSPLIRPHLSTPAGRSQSAAGPSGIGSTPETGLALDPKPGGGSGSGSNQPPPPHSREAPLGF